MKWLLAILVPVAFCGGFWLGGSEAPRSTRPDEPAFEPVVRENPQAEVEAPEGMDSPRTEKRVPGNAVVEVSGGADDGDALFSGRLLQHHDREFRKGWASVRPDRVPDDVAAQGLEDFRTSVLTVSETLGRRAAEEKTEAEATQAAFEIGDGLIVLQAIADGGAVLPPCEETSKLLDRIFEPRASGSSIDGTTLDPKGPALRDGMVVEFGPGQFELKSRSLRDEDGKFPRDLTISGAGINATLVKFDELSPRGPVERLTIRDMTVDCGNNYLFDARRGGVTLDLRSVRIVRFDMGAGGSLIFGVNEGLVLRARDCEFLGGYGRSPGSGNFSRGAAKLFHFDGCTFGRIDLRDSRSGPVHFPSCRFREFSRDPHDMLPDATFSECVVEPLIGIQEYLDRTVQSLTEFFPGWQE